MTLPSTTLIVTAFPTGSIVPKCPTCDLVFEQCTKDACEQDGSKPDECAKRCLAYLCYGDHNAPFCKSGPCRPAACPNSKPRLFETAQPAIPFTTVLSFPGTTITVTPTPTFTEPGLVHSTTPQCDEGHGITPNGKWTMLFEHKIQQRPDNATFKWDLWDEHGCPAGSGLAWNQFLGFDISTEIGAFERSQDYRMGYTLHTNVTESLSRSESEIYFQISKPVADCKEMCHTGWKVNKREPNDSWQIFNDCAQQCGSQKLTPNDVSCEAGVNKWQDNGDNPISIRGGYCTFSMPFTPANDNSPTSWTRDSRWTLDIIQTMEHDQGSFEWWLKDPNGNDVSTQKWDTSKAFFHSGEKIMGGLVADPGMLYNMYITIRSPLTKKNSTVELSYLNDPLPSKPPCNFCNKQIECPEDTPTCQPSYRTERDDETSQSLLDDCTQGQNLHDNEKLYIGVHRFCLTSVFKNTSEFSCDGVPDAFYPKNAGFQRHFKCWWPHDFVEPYSHQRADSASGENLLPHWLRTATRPPWAAGALAIDGGGGVNESWMNATFH